MTDMRITGEWQKCHLISFSHTSLIRAQSVVDDDLQTDRQTDRRTDDDEMILSPKQSDTDTTSFLCAGLRCVRHCAIISSYRRRREERDANPRCQSARVRLSKMEDARSSWCGVWTDVVAFVELIAMLTSWQVRDECNCSYALRIRWTNDGGRDGKCWWISVAAL